MRKLIIEGIEADVSKMDMIALSKKIIDWQDLSSKSSNYSNTIKLPKTPTNNRIFANAADVSAVIERKFYQVDFIENFNQVITYGKGVLIGTDDFYRFAFYWGNIDLKAQLEGYTLRDLDMADVEHLWFITNATQLELFGGAISYLVANVYADETALEEGVNNTTAIPNYVPFVDADYIIGKIEDLCDVQLVGLTGQRMFTPVTTNIDRPELELQLSTIDWQSLFQTTFDYVFPTDTKVFSFNSRFNTVVKDDGAANAQPSALWLNNSTTQITVTATIKNNFQVWIQHPLNNGATAGLLMESRFEKSVGGVWIPIETFTEEIQSLEWNVRTTYATDSYSVTTSVLAGERIRVRHTFTLTTVGTGRTTCFFVVDNVDGSTFTVKTGALLYGSTWNIAKNLPATPLWDFLRDVMFLRGVIFENTEANVFTFKKVQSVFTDIAQELTGKLQNYEIEKIHTDLAQRNLVKYENEDYLGELGQHEFTINDNTLKSIDDYIEIGFSASREVPWRSSQVGKVELFGEKDEFDNIKARVFYIANASNVRYTNPSATAFATATDKYTAQFAGLEMVNVWLEFYLQYQSILNDFKLVKCQMNLDVNDFVGMDMLRPVHIQQIGTFIIDIIDKYKEGKLTEVKLIKI